jgi:protocatechuate 3,4-dioxygenase beta subunit
MKNRLILLILVCFYCTIAIVNAQTVTFDENQNYLERHPVYDYTEAQLNSVDSVSDFESKTNKLKLTGVIFENDGLTPAKDVILFIEQPDEHGNFDLRVENDKRYVHHRAWVKTDAEGRYTIYTFIPGNDRTHNQFKQLFPVIKEPSNAAYEIETFLFDDDPLISKYCRKRLAKKGDITRILKPKNVDGMLVAERNIILPINHKDTK